MPAANGVAEPPRFHVDRQPGRRGVDDKSTALVALADPARRRLLDLLSENGPQTASTLAGSFEISRQAVTKHLATLENAALVHRSLEGRAVFFEINPRELRATARWVSTVTNRWEERVDRLAAILEATE